MYIKWINTEWMNDLKTLTQTYKQNIVIQLMIYTYMYKYKLCRFINAINISLQNGNLYIPKLYHDW